MAHRTMESDPRYVADIKSGVPTREARSKWRSRLRATRHTAVLQAWVAMRRLMGAEVAEGVGQSRTRQRVVTTAAHLDKDPANRDALQEEALPEYTEGDRRV